MFTSATLSALNLHARWSGNVARLSLCRASSQVQNAREPAQIGRTISCQLVQRDRQAKLRFLRWTAGTQRAAKGCLRALCSVPVAQAGAQEDLKRCTKCGVEKHLSEFHADKRGKEGLKSRCKACTREADRLRRAKYRAEALMNSDTASPSSPTPGAKLCSTCQKVLPRSDFSRSLGSANGLQTECKLCRSQRFKALREARRAAGARPTVNSKKCTLCKRLRAASEFCTSFILADGLEGQCKQCKLKRKRVIQEAKRAAGAQPTVEFKKCSNCKQLKAASEFGVDLDCATRLRPRCNECSFSVAKQGTTAMTPEQIQAKRDEWTARRRVCRVCKLEQPGSEFEIKISSYMGQRNTCSSCLRKANRRRRAGREPAAT